MFTFGIMALASLSIASLMGGGSSDEGETTSTNNEEQLETETDLQIENSESSENRDTEAEDVVAEDETLSANNTAPEEDVAPEDTDTQSSEEATAQAPRAFTAPPIVTPPVLSLDELVSVATLDEVEIPDALVLEDGPETGEDQDRTYLLQAPDGEHTIELGYHTDTTFSVTPNDQTDRVSVYLNTNISEGDSTEVSNSEDKVDSEGNPFTDTWITKEFNSSKDIVLNVDQSHVGVHVAQIDLSNPEDTLRIFFSNIHGFTHLVTNEVETSGENGSLSETTRTLYVIETSLEYPELAASEIDLILSGDGAVDSETQLIAEIFLGTSSLDIDGLDNDAVPTSQTITNFINDDPQIRTNFYWASESEHDGGPLTQTTGLSPLVAGVTQVSAATAANQGQALTPETQPNPSADQGTTTSDLFLTAEEAQEELERASDRLDQALDDLDSLDIPGFNANTAVPSYLRI